MQGANVQDREETTTPNNEVARFCAMLPEHSGRTCYLPSPCDTVSACFQSPHDRRGHITPRGDSARDSGQRQKYWILSER